MNNKQLVVKELKAKVVLIKYVEEHAFNFNLAFNENITKQIYLLIVKSMIEVVYHKKGKQIYDDWNKKKIPGLYLLAAYDIFTLL